MEGHSLRGKICSYKNIHEDQLNVKLNKILGSLNCICFFSFSFIDCRHVAINSEGYLLFGTLVQWYKEILVAKAMFVITYFSIFQYFNGYPKWYIFLVVMHF